MQERSGRNPRRTPPPRRGYGDDGLEEVRSVSGVVTAIVASPRRQGRFDLALDGKSAAVVSLDQIERFGLCVGRVLDEVSGAAVAAAAAELATYDRAIGMLAAHGRSAKELRRRLVLKGELPAHAEAAIARLAEAGLLDDAEYARQVARSRAVGRGDSRRRVAQVLAQKGVARDVADEAVAEVYADEAVDEEASVEGAARKKLRSLTGLDAPTQRRRLYAFLARRGFDADVIRRAMDRTLRAAGDDGDPDDRDELPADDE